MAPKNCSPFALFLVLNILLFAFVSASGNVSIQCPPKPKPTPTPNPPKPKPTPTPSGGCPRNALKLGVCSSVLSGLFNFTTGVPSTPCCTFMDGLVDYDVAICVCTALKANIMGFPINIPISFTKLLNFCSRQVPSDFHCFPDKN